MRYFLTILIGLFILIGCSDDDPDPVPEPDPIELAADAGADQSKKRNEEVTLDGTGTVGPVGTNSYVWSMTSAPEGIEEDNINLQDKSSATATFTPPVIGIYEFTLDVTASDGQASSDKVEITVTGSEDLGGTLTESIILKNIESDPSLPDYEITSDLTIPDGIILSLGEGSINIKVHNNVGIIIESGGLLNQLLNVTNTKFTSDIGWKGFLIKDNGFLKLTDAIIELAGSAIFDGQTDAASIFTENFNSLQLVSITFIKSSSYDILSPKPFSTVAARQDSFEDIVFSNAIPLKAYIGILYFLEDEDNFTFPSDMERIEITTYNGEARDGLALGKTIVFNSHHYRMLGNFVTTTNTLVREGAKLTFPENAGWIQLDGNLKIDGTESNPVTIESENGLKWKGIAGGFTSTIQLDNVVMDNAGNGLNAYSDDFDTFTQIHLASLFQVDSVTNTTIKNSNGYGIAEVHYFSGNTFDTSALAGALMRPEVSLSDNPNNTFTMSAGVPAVEYLEGEVFSGTPSLTYGPIGGNNFYLFHDLTINFDLTILPGTIMKFASGSALTIIGSVPGTITAIGEAENPIILDGEDGVPGSWDGLMLFGEYNIQNCEIRNAGGSLIEGATEKANVVFKNPGIGSVVFDNNIVSGSAANGAVVEAGAFDPFIQGTNNTFQDIAEDAIKKK